MLFLYLFFCQGTAEAHFWEAGRQVFSYTIDRKHFGSRENHQAYRLAESELGGGVLFGTTLPGLEPGITGCQSTAHEPKAHMRVEVDQRLVHWATGSCKTSLAQRKVLLK